MVDDYRELAAALREPFNASSPEFTVLELMAAAADAIENQQTTLDADLAYMRKLEALLERSVAVCEAVDRCDEAVLYESVREALKAWRAVVGLHPTPQEPQP